MKREDVIAKLNSQSDGKQDGKQDGKPDGKPDAQTGSTDCLTVTVDSVFSFASMVARKNNFITYANEADETEQDETDKSETAKN